MHINSYKIKYFKNSIIGLKATLTTCSANSSFENQTGVIQAGESINRFSLALEKPITVNQEKVNSVPLTEDDEIYLIPD